MFNVTLLFDAIHTGSPDHFGVLSGWQWEFIRTKLLRVGLSPDRVSVKTLSDFDEGSLSEGSIIVGFGESVLRGLTERKSIDKWHLSPLRTRSGHLFIPTFDLSRAAKQYELGLYIEIALQRASEFLKEPPRPAEERFHLNPGIEETLHVLKEIKEEPELSIDVETGYGQINTVGFAWSPSDAIAINVLPERCGSLAYYEIWDHIRSLLEAPSRKILQNFIYDVSYFSAYGIKVENIHHDTMWGMRFLWPELDVNLGNVGRMYTRRVYWKDDGRVESEEGKKKDWGNVRDWLRHYQYNCRDTTGTFESYRAQQVDLKDRGLDKVFYGYLKRLIEPVREMCRNGMPLSLEVRDALKTEVQGKLDALTLDFKREVKSDLNPSSPKQVLDYIKSSGVSIPKVYDKAKGIYRESTDAKSIKKIRLKNDLPGLKELQQIKTLGKALSSYIDFDVRPDGRLSYSLNGAGTETLRWSGGKDPWDRGFNIQTIPREGGDVSIKSMFVAPEGYSFIEIDLRQAESRFVAYDSADKALIEMLESGADVHSHVGNAILRQMGKDPSVIPKDEFKSTWRQLGKKAGHGLNYGMKASVFVETVFNELDMVISKKDAELITKAYYGLFPGIPRWHAWIRNELYNKRKLTTPSGWERYFYGRPGDDMFKEAAAFRPQHTIPWITNNLMLHLIDQRKHGSLRFHLIAQVHDSLIMLTPDEGLESVMRESHEVRKWHPEVTLTGGQMIIPVETKFGKCMATLEEWTT